MIFTYYSRSAFLSNIGGILGLCAGASIVSVIEIVWYVGLACTRLIAGKVE